MSIDADGSISIMSPATEMGQGSMTSLPRILAEELDADWSKVRVVPAPPIDEVYGNPGFGGMLYTAGSNAVRNYYEPLRLFGAAVRRVLLENVALRLHVPVSELTTEPSVVVHARSGRRLTYARNRRARHRGSRDARAMTAADLKPTSAFRLIGHDTMRVELPSKVNGSAQYAIDVQVPGMLYATVLRAPVEGSAPDRIDDAAARAISGVMRDRASRLRRRRAGADALRRDRSTPGAHRRRHLDAAPARRRASTAIAPRSNSRPPRAIFA